MSQRMLHHSALTVLLFSAILTFLPPSYGQLNKQFIGVFSEILDQRLRRSAGTHGTHFLQSAEDATKGLTPALNNLIVNNISSFPLSSSTVGISFDFSSGVPVSTIESLGPIFSETAGTIGRGKINVALSYSNLNLTTFRGLPTEDMRFTFTHEDISGDSTLGDNPTEGDLIDVYMGMKVRAHIVVLFGTVGVTDNFDVGVGIPLINVSLSGNALAQINSFTYPRFGYAFHEFGADSLNPVLQTTVPYDGSATGLGDIALKLKYTFMKGGKMDVAALADIRLPTGKQEDYLGTGKTTFRIAGVLSKRINNFTPHVNVGYESRAGSQSDRIDIRAGFDQMVLPSFTFALDFLGTVDLNSDKAVKLFPGTRDIVFNGPISGDYTSKVWLSNVPERDNDNVFNVSVGFRFAPSERVMLMANILAPLNDGGLRASVVPTIGLTANF